ncbi:MAG: double-strand break repair helicase AddA, partial [Bombella apis]|nr:double-strand break repair helicase AddA [Bombella apis]
QALGIQGGRTRFLSRLGPEAAEPIDELLTAALTYETQHPPSLQGFLQWLRASTVESQREAETVIDAVRLMTAHRSKGLQARLVILPHTTHGPGKADPLLWAGLEGDDVEGPLWVPQTKMHSEQTTFYSAQEQERQREESNRLLYVALTRASDALLICGWEPKRAPKIPTWYDYCYQGLRALQSQTIERLASYQPVASPFEGGWEGEKIVLERPVEAAVSSKVAEPHPVAPPILPEWMGHAPDWQIQPAPHEDALARPLAPSRPDSAAYGPLPAARSPLEIMREGLVIPQPVKRRQDAMERGVLVHRLLQFLPDIAALERQEKAESWLRHTMPGVDEVEIIQLAKQVVSIVEMPLLAPLFGPGSRAEQGISGTLGRAGDGTGRVVLGQVDRFCFDGQTVWLCDYKTGHVPSQPGRIPAAYRAQMASYRRVMQGLYPGHEARCFLVWVDGPLATELPPALLEEALQSVR